MTPRRKRLKRENIGWAFMNIGMWWMNLGSWCFGLGQPHRRGALGRYLCRVWLQNVRLKRLYGNERRPSARRARHFDD